MAETELLSDSSEDERPPPPAAVEAPPRRMGAVQRLRHTVAVAEAECCLPALRMGRHAAKRADARLAYEYGELRRPIDRLFRKEVVPRYKVVEARVEERLEQRAAVRAEQREVCARAQCAAAFARAVPASTPGRGRPRRPSHPRAWMELAGEAAGGRGARAGAAAALGPGAGAALHLQRRRGARGEPRARALPHPGVLRPPLQGAVDERRPAPRGHAHRLGLPGHGGAA
jgi:hypothetical protein